MTQKALSGVFVMGALLVSSVLPSAEYMKREDISQLKIRGGQICQPLLPYQAVRLRFVVQNVGDRRIVPMIQPSALFNIRGIRSPSDNDFRPARCPELPDDLRAPVGQRKLPPAALQLKPGQTISVTFCMAADWRCRRPTPPDGRPLFPQPGIYQTLWRTNQRYELPVTVAAPQGADKEIWRMMTEDTYLADAMMSPAHAADPDAVETMKEIVWRHPQSSYADYARFALARAHVKGGGYFLTTDDRDLAKGVEFTLSQFEDSDEQLREALTDHFDVGHLRGTRARIVDDLVRARKVPPAARQAAISAFVALKRITAEDRAAAVRLLEDIKNRDFAYAPNALVLLWKILRRDDPERAKNVADRLTREYPDSCEWILEMTDLIREPDAWLKFRTTKPPQ